MDDKRLKDTKAQYINPFLEAFYRACNKMMGEAPSIGDATLTELQELNFEVMLLLHLAGDLEGLVFFSMQEETALKFISSTLLGMPVHNIQDIENHALQEFVSRTTKYSREALAKKGYSCRIISQIRINEAHYLSNPTQFLHMSFRFPFGNVFVHIHLYKPSANVMPETPQF